VKEKDRIFDVLDQLQPIADEKGCTLAQLALAWVAQQPAVTSPIIGPRTMEQLEDNLGALNVTITDEDRAKFDSIVPPGRMVSPFYDANFGPSVHRW
jgi:aryl-alcohol dehydrogenase-like predicted oxidoreductase